MPKVIEFSDKSKYEKWLAEKGDMVQVISAVPSRKKWSPLTGVFTNDQTYTVTYEDVAQTRRSCPHCAEMIMREAKVCRFCGREVEPLAPLADVVPVVISGGKFVRCPSCNTKNYVTATCCEKCGIRFRTA